ncbi:MAG: sugar transferase, partial [Gordonibacter sp.]|uniref:sugar transferase n=1 Tax=Gordonibacter sp. TaxID=1968902 RepID=UPI002FC7A3ED
MSPSRTKYDGGTDLMYAHFIKRVLDLIIGILVMPLLLFLVIAIAPFIYFEDKGPVFYNAPRVGKNGKP